MKIAMPFLEERGLLREVQSAKGQVPRSED
jgi:hypothetical protein